MSVQFGDFQSIFEFCAAANIAFVALTEAIEKLHNNRKEYINNIIEDCKIKFRDEPKVQRDLILEEDKLQDFFRDKITLFWIISPICLLSAFPSIFFLLLTPVLSEMPIDSWGTAILLSAVILWCIGPFLIYLYNFSVAFWYSSVLLSRFTRIELELVSKTNNGD